jgi:NAD(P)-dependent dehydrogenase (short-subunit alcohol dehydrogenase family)
MDSREPDPGYQKYTAPTDLLNDRVVLVTGAGSGIGRAAALAFAKHGAQVVLLGRTLSKLESVYDEIVSANGTRPSIAHLNLTSARGPEYFQLRDSLDEEFGRLDGLLHNAGTLGDRAPLEQYDIGQWTEVMHLNLTVPFVLTQTLLPLLNASGDASVIFTSSGVGRRARAFWGAYAVSKFGTEGLMQVLADETEGAGRIRVNSINPGRARTPMRASAYPAEDPNSVPEPSELMRPYLYLMGPDSRGVTGQSLDSQ